MTVAREVGGRPRRREARRAIAGSILLLILAAAYLAAWSAANGEAPCGWGIFQP
ncbi:MAG TPA: hypothetical protein VFT32_13405 [Candidatus Eisenbacteria bacterium]|nr:hypothetical protein [Candidatus Eisenbacteria bacterium]